MVARLLLLVMFLPGNGTSRTHAGTILLHCREEIRPQELECSIQDSTIRRARKYAFAVACPHQHRETAVVSVRSLRSRVEVIPKVFFKSFPRLREVNFAQSGVEELESDAFEAAKRLKVLELTGNRLRKLTKKCFYGAFSVEVLALGENEIDFVDKDAFFGLTSLKILDLNNNRISKLDRNVFEHVSKIEIVDLSQNLLKLLTLNSSNFELKLLNLSFNALDHFSVENSSVKILDLTQNNLKEIGPIQNLEILNLSSNPWVQINNKNFPDFGTLKVLNLSQSNLSRIDTNSFQSLQSLEVLDLSKNFLKSLKIATFSPLKALSHLFLDQNQLETLDFETLSNFPNLKMVSIVDNRWGCNYLKKIKEMFCKADTILRHRGQRPCLNDTKDAVEVPKISEKEVRTARFGPIFGVLLLVVGVVLGIFGLFHFIPCKKMEIN